LIEFKFFKPTVLYKEYMILDMIEKNPNITQREMSKAIGIAVSMINQYLDQYEKNRFIKKKKHSSKTVDYIITNRGVERKKYLNISYLHASQHLYNSAKENIDQFLINLEKKGFKNILLYGAGEVCEILLNAIKSSKNSNISAIALIDDDINKIGTFIENTPIISRESLASIEHDGILISSYTNNEAIFNKLLNLNYERERIIRFFNI